MNNQQGIVPLAYRYVRALARWIKAGRPVRTPEEVQKIYEVCKKCSIFDEAANICKHCGCRVAGHANPLMNKIAIGTAKAWQTPQIYRNDLLAAEIYPDSDNFENSATVLQTGTGGVVDRIEFLYNRLGEKVAKRDQNGTVHAYEYDNLARLLHDKVLTFASNVDTLVQKISSGYNVTGSIGSVTSYTGNGNVINQVKYEYGDNQKLARLYQSHGGAVSIFANEADVCTHDRNGNMTLMPGLKDKYDAWNRLVEVRDSANSLIARYDYNGVNQRIQKVKDNVVTHSYFNEQWQELETIESPRSPNGTRSACVWGLRYIDDLIYRQCGTEKLYSLADPNWNVVATADSTGAVQERLKYNAFGKVEGLTSDWNRTFTGQVFDGVTGLMLYRNRYYHSELGRFVTRDPIGYEASVLLRHDFGIQ